MNEFFGSRRLTVSEAQLEQLDDVSISETARSLLDKANIATNILMFDAKRSNIQHTVRDLARDLFIKLT